MVAKSNTAVCRGTYRRHAKSTQPVDRRGRMATATRARVRALRDRAVYNNIDTHAAPNHLARHHSAVDVSAVSPNAKLAPNVSESKAAATYGVDIQLRGHTVKRKEPMAASRE